VTTIAAHFKTAPKGFFDNARPEDDEGFDWDLGEEEKQEEKEEEKKEEDVDIGNL
jgi:hypothetical protein